MLQVRQVLQETKGHAGQAAKTLRKMEQAAAAEAEKAVRPSKQEDSDDDQLNKTASWPKREAAGAISKGVVEHGMRSGAESPRAGV